MSEDAIANLQRRVAALEGLRDNQALDTALKSQAAQQQVANQIVETQKVTCGNSRGPLKTYDFKREPIKEQQATEHLYAPLRSDTAPLIEMSAFVRKVANTQLQDVGDPKAYRALVSIVFEAWELVKKHT